MTADGERADAPEARSDEVSERRHRPDKTPEHPLGDDRRHFAPAGPGGNLRDRGPLRDDDGEDIRMYTGEPVETEDGWVLPQQQNVGPGNDAGSGEWPDPDTPPATEPPADSGDGGAVTAARPSTTNPT